MAYYVIDVENGKVASAFGQKRDAQQYAEAKQTRIVTTEIGDRDGDLEDDATPTWGAVKTLAEHVVEADTKIDDRLQDLERRMDRAERDIDLIDGGY